MPTQNIEHEVQEGVMPSKGRMIMSGTTVLLKVRFKMAFKIRSRLRFEILHCNLV